MQYRLKTELDAVNSILRKLGEPPISSMDTQYPTLDLILPALDQAQRNLLEEGWWFNKFEPVTLYPDEESHVVVPPDTLVFTPYSDEYLYTGTYIRRRNGTVDLTEPVTGSRVANLPFEELPPMVRSAVTYSAAMQVYAADIGMDDIFTGIQENYSGAYAEMSAAHTRQRQFNVRSKRNIMRWRQFLRS